MSSIFNTNQASSGAPSAGSLFASNNNAANNTSSGGGLFGSNLNKPPAAPGASLFAGLGNTTTNNSNNNTSGSQAAPSTAGSFGGSTLIGSTLQGPYNPTTSGAGLFGGATNQAAAPQAGASTNMLGGLGNTQGQSQAGQARPVADKSQPARFLDLLERGKKSQHTNGNAARLDGLPSLQLGLVDISSKIRNLTGAPQTDSRADYVLSGSGVPRGANRQNLDDFGVAGEAGSAEVTAPFESDIDAYVANLRAKSTLDLINESMEQTRRDFDSFLDEQLAMNLDAQRRRAYEYFGLARPLDRASADTAPGASLGGSFGNSKSRTVNGRRTGAFGRSTRGGDAASASVLGRSTLRGTLRQSQFTDIQESANAAPQPSALDDPFQRSRQDRYAAKVKELNLRRLEEIVYPVVEEFAQVELNNSGDTPKHLQEAYKALKDIVREHNQVQRPSDPGAVRERQYRDSYLDATPNSPRSLQLRRQILDGSRKYLEDSFFAQVNDDLKRNLAKVSLGGVPSKINKMKAWVALRAEQKNLASDSTELQTIGPDYCWALVFYLLRAGLVQEAARYVAENERAIKNMDRNFATYMSLYARDPDRRLPRDYIPKIQSEYGQRSRLAPNQSIDPYRMACYKVIGRCEVAKKAIEGINTSIEDFLWLIFSLAREVNRAEESAVDVFGLEEVRGVVEEIGQRVFQSPGVDGAPSYAVYFLMQVLAGMFEQAISWLYQYNYVAAVHFAIALSYYGLLRVADFDTNPDQLLSYTTTQKPQISFCRLLGYYTQDFRISNAEAASDYLTLICLNADLDGDLGKSQASIAHEGLKELVLVTREFALLLGDVTSDGRRLPGAVEQRVPLLCLTEDQRREFLHALTIQSAAAADDSGRTTDAVLLYHLAEEYDNVTAIVNRALSDALNVDPGQEPLRLQPLKPRADLQADQPATTLVRPEDRSTLSLTAVDDPLVLAQNMYTLYERNGYIQRVREENRNAYQILSFIAAAKTAFVQNRWAMCVDQAKLTTILPLEANGNTAIIRACAQGLSAQPPVVSRLIGNLLVWVITSLSRQREVLRQSAYEQTNQASVYVLQNAKDLMVFAGLIRYKLSVGVFEMLARVGQGVVEII